MTAPSATQSPLILTIGHSTRSLDEFLDLVKSNGVTLLADVRTVPKSRHNPQFNQETLPAELNASGIEYLHLPGLGGLRHSQRRPSPNMGWENAAFRNYADYMLEWEFEETLSQLMEQAKRSLVAVMCAEALPWRCHRNLISDALLVRGFRVEHIMGDKKRQEHKLTPWASVSGTVITYPQPE